MEVLKTIWDRFLNLFGFKHDTKYVKNYLNDANMRSGIFMSAIIALLEFALIFRQHDKYIFPALQADPTQNYWQVLFDNTSLFWLMMTFGLSMLGYCIFYLDKRLKKWKLITVIALAAVGLLFCIQLPFESSLRSFIQTIEKGKTNSYKSIVMLILLFILYSSIFLFHVSVIVSSILRFKGKKINWLQSVLVITLFAMVCLVFGVRVSYGDFYTSAQIQSKQFICFLMFTIYVGCLLIWKPYASIGILGAIFLGFYFVIKNGDSTMTVHFAKGAITGFYDNAGNVVAFDDPNVAYAVITNREWLDGDEVNYLTFFISLAMVCVSIYSQRIAEARKDEQLEVLATVDTLTGLNSFEYFVTLCKEKHQDKSIEQKYAYFFIDISSFKIFNEKRGFEAGNAFLKKIGEILKEHFPHDLITRQGDDHFVIFAPIEGAEERLNLVHKEIEKYDTDIRPGINAGGNIIIDVNEDPRLSIEKARYAVDEIKRKVGVIFCLYDEEMHKRYELMQYIVHHVDEAVENGYIKPYYQPVVYAKDQTLCGFEALTRWIDPVHGFMNPGLFIGVLEDSQLVYKIDFAMLELVCKDLRRRFDEKLPVVPVSINFSRVDFLVMDVETGINEIIQKYNIPKDYIHVEITESALNSQGDNLKASLNSIKKHGLAIWLDDFGSGYSSFNALKDYEFDVLKLDLEFLKGFGQNAKSRPLIKSVIDMANLIGMRTLSEGVETEEQAEFLKEIGCLRLQGYLFGKPEPYDVVSEKITNSFFKVAEDPFK